jgi:hypothetical protein
MFSGPLSSLVNKLQLAQYIEAQATKHEQQQPARDMFLVTVVAP